MSSFDALIIGAGHNGLAAAITLQKRGRRVLVLEARSVAGGLCAAREFHPGFTAPGVLHDTFEVRAPLLDALGLAQHGLSLRDADVPVHAPTSKDKGFILAHDPERSQLGEDQAGYAELCRVADAARGALSTALDAAPPPMIPGQVSDFFDFAKLGLSLRALGAKDLYGFLRMLPMCIADLTRDHFKNETVMAALAGATLLDEYVGPWSAGTAARWLLQRAVSGKEVAGGPAALVRALKASLESAGGSVRTGARVAALLVEKGQVVGVKLEGGEALRAGLVGVAIAPRALLPLLPPHALPLNVFDELSRVRARGTSAKVHLALEAPIETRGGRHERLRMGDSLDDLERAFDAIKYRQLSRAPALDVRQPTVADLSLAPRDKAVASIWVNFAPYDVDGGWSDDRRKAVLDAVLARIERYDAGIRQKVIAAEVLDPKTLEAEYGAPNGNVHHAEMSLDQLLFMRPTLRLAHYRTPVEGLFLCGSGSHPGGGVRLAPGWLGARAALEGWAS
ncbi:MAG: NAD(P)/FAD-dependent oxidoreductase [Myxococcaceae bacterium]|nr:NAD(P)/FAD-dependent oxidoreductase [Myxococcaceae bacterium]